MAQQRISYHYDCAFPSWDADRQETTDVEMFGLAQYIAELCLFVFGAASVEPGHCFDLDEASGDDGRRNV